MTKLKICGLRDPDNALAAARMGADFLGIVFVPGVRRQVTPQQADSITQRLRSRARTARTPARWTVRQPASGGGEPHCSALRTRPRPALRQRDAGLLGPGSHAGDQAGQGPRRRRPPGFRQNGLSPGGRDSGRRAQAPTGQVREQRARRHRPRLSTGASRRPSPSGTTSYSPAA